MGYKMAIQSQSQAHGQVSVIPLTNLPQGTSQSQGSQHTSNLIISRCTVSSAAGPLQQSAVAIGQSQGAPSIPTLSPGQSLSRWTWSRNSCSSSRINTWIALIALGIGAYYYYGQYILAWKTWETGLWKDCHDRPDFSNTSICIRYSNVSYEELASRAVVSVISAEAMNITMKPTLISPDQLVTPTSQIRDYWTISASCIFFTSYITAILAVVFHVLVFVCDMTSGHNFPRGAYLAVFVLINSLIASMKLKPGVWQNSCTVVSVGLVVFWGPSIQKAWKACLNASCDPKKRFLWERNSIWGLFCDPLFLFLLFTVPILLDLQGVTYDLLPEDVQGVIGMLYSTASWSFIAFFAILSVGQSAILKTKNDRELDVEAQSMHVIKVSHKLLFLENLYSVGNGFTKIKLD